MILTAVSMQGPSVLSRNMLGYSRRVLKRILTLGAFDLVLELIDILSIGTTVDWIIGYSSCVNELQTSVIGTEPDCICHVLLLSNGGIVIGVHLEIRRHNGRIEIQAFKAKERNCLVLAMGFATQHFGPVDIEIYTGVITASSIKTGSMQGFSLRRKVYPLGKPTRMRRGIQVSTTPLSP
jgi:hypothetical protein